MFDEEKAGDARFSFAGGGGDPGVQQEERRTGQRHISILRVGKVVTPRGEDLCLIRNISAGGLMARVYTRLDVGQHVLFELRADRRLAGVVRWVRDDNVGVQFDDPIDVAAVLSDRDLTESEHRPRAPRLSRPCKAKLRVGARYHRVTVRDISQGGAKIEAPVALAVDTDIILTLDGFRAVAGSIRWSRDGQSGIAFNQVIPYPELTGWLKETQPG